MSNAHQQEMALYCILRPDDDTPSGGTALTLCDTARYRGRRHFSANALLEKHLTVSEMTGVWQAMVDKKDHITSFNIQCTNKDFWSAFGEDNWRQLCHTIGVCLPHVMEVTIPKACSIQDHWWAILFHNLPSQLQSLSIRSVHENLPKSFQQIGSSFPNLQRLQVCGDCLQTLPMQNADCLSMITFQALATSLRGLEKLQAVLLQNLVLDHQTSWMPVLEVLRTNPNLEQVSVRGGWERVLERTVRGGWERVTVEEEEEAPVCSFHRIHLTKETLAALQFGPRISEASEKFLLGSGSTTENWVSAILFVQDRLDCVHHLVTRMDPSLFLHAQ